MSKRPLLIAMDLEGVFTPEVWIAVAETTGIPELRLTTRDISDYDVLMKRRLAILKENGLKLKDIQDVISTMDPLPGAKEYLDRLRSRFQAIVLSDTYYEFAEPFMRKLGWPTLFCNSLEVDEEDNVVDYHLRLKDGKRHAVLGFKQLNFDVIAMGDSYNDTTMLLEAELGILFRPSERVIEDFPQLPVALDYEEVDGYINDFVSERG
ncbi:MAG: bifunctional phosphoserine phosphatase/homoserine phosphotransferase ThrH [Lentisphaerae bacterium]|jgi:phosphoserine / homoserine phosphotransferase|nr:bifunctional phosphoserine phosphatase/homoserine phosphotransferase ThrH [Lentisphaerota bacterium]MBT4818746.1 bifunctional phosphoserine phosphatase/homoserine phosphotransferase ThrH [Lentisphaerota bacterium]MBT5605909.1 bifunctional phosphoserine phosphatase/homoserine phosphotransferase ThrH [Lentisphaerota bacterium]MBT7057988.1 bifunctional phosphoserine phosphatase/homoserine phosphotransferase ThrH [Lentisphaerota bacterium]MBT7848543.1 bifunctional phosphoserine phosphatase/homos